MIYVVKEKGRKQTFERFGTYRNRTEHILITRFCGEVEMYDWDGSELGVEELKRFMDWMIANIPSENIRG